MTSIREAVALSASMRRAICAGLSMVGPYARGLAPRPGATLVHDHRVLRSHLPDLTPLRENPAYRRLYAGFTLSNIGSQMAVVAIGLQVYAITGSTASVGLVGFFALVPLVAFGLYGGSLSDHHDRRLVALVANLVAWATSIACALQAWLGNENVWVLYALVAVWNGAFGVSSPARQSIYPRILPREQLPAANALGVFAMSTAMMVGPLMAGLLVDWGGFATAYTVDALVTLAALWGLWRLQALPPEPHAAGEATRAGLASVLDGFRFLRGAPNVRMTFVADIAAMLLAQPRVLFPAAGAVILGGGASTVGYLYAAAAVGAVLATLTSGRLGGRAPAGPGDHGEHRRLGRRHHRARRRAARRGRLAHPDPGPVGRAGRDGVRRGGGCRERRLPHDDPAVGRARPDARAPPGGVHRGGGRWSPGGRAARRHGGRVDR